MEFGNRVSLNVFWDKISHIALLERYPNNINDVFSNNIGIKRMTPHMFDLYDGLYLKLKEGIKIDISRNGMFNYIIVVSDKYTYVQRLNSEK